MNQTTKDILCNKEVISVNQDSAGIQGKRLSAQNGLEVWCKPLGSANGKTKAVALLNRTGSAANITVKFSDIGLTGEATVRDLWAKADKGKFTGTYSMSVPSHGTGMLKISTEIPIRVARTYGSNEMAGYNVKRSTSSIIVSPVGNLKQFDISVYMPDGRLITRKTGTAGNVVIPAQKSCVYILNITYNGHSVRETVSFNK